MSDHTCKCGHPRSVHVDEDGPCHNPAACFCEAFRYNVPSDEFQAALAAPSTPAPQDQTELDEYLRVVADCANLEVALARERESRKQAEAALRLVEHKLEQFLSGQYNQYPFPSLQNTLTVVRTTLKPVQEPAERERGK